MATLTEVMMRLQAMARPDRLPGIEKFGLPSEGRLGLSVPALRGLAKELGRDHILALALWQRDIIEAKLLAVLIDHPSQVTEAQMDAWVQDIHSWDVCDGATTGLFDGTPFAWKKVAEWAERDEEFVKRAAFALLAGLAAHDKTAPDARFIELLPVIVRAATDDRNFVKKAVNWALRNIGKRNLALNAVAIAAAREIRQLDSRAARWIAADALRELQGEAVQKRLAKGLPPHIARL